MNERAINTVITNYAIENANLKLAVATLQAEKETLSAQIAENKEVIDGLIALDEEPVEETE